MFGLTKGSKTMIIHGVPISVHTRKAILAAMLKNIPHRFEPVIPFNPPENWRALSPTGLIPALQDGDFTCADSTAICLYMERKAPSPAILPKDDRDYACVLALNAYASDALFRGVVHGLFFQKVIGPGMLGQPTDQSAIDKILAEALPPAFVYLDSLAEGAFLVGKTLSLADIAVASNLINFRYLGYQIDAGPYPRLARWFEGLLRREPFRAALANETPFAEQMGLDRGFVSETQAA